MLKKHFYIILFISWVVFITLLSLFSFPGNNDDGFKIPFLDKIAHFVFYFGFVVLGSLFLRENTKEPHQLSIRVLRILVVAILYGILIEVLQDIMPFDRTAEVLDVLANTTGAIFGSLLIKKYFSRSRKLK